MVEPNLGAAIVRLRVNVDRLEAGIAQEAIVLEQTKGQCTGTATRE